MSTAAELPTGLNGGLPSALPEAYRTLIAHGQAHGVIGRPGSRQANAYRDQLGLPAQRGGRLADSSGGATVQSTGSTSTCCATAPHPPRRRTRRGQSSPWPTLPFATPG